nr:GNAT family N-acetyltransferase [uncultured Clostridium sp.]
MDNYIIDEIDLNAINRILDIYNSNKSFLCNHLGVSSVSKEFILNEIEEMKKIGFNSSIIKDHTGEVIGLCDFKISHEVYLSLLMIDYRLKGNGLGKTIYNQLEKMFKSNNVQSIRIDVVYDYEEYNISFI